LFTLVTLPDTGHHVFTESAESLAMGIDSLGQWLNEILNAKV